MLGAFWKKHFRLKQFYPFHENPSLFIASQWQRDKNTPHIAYLAYRTTVTVLFFTTWVLSMVAPRTKEKWPIFLTNWGYTMCTLQSLLVLAMVASVTLGDSMRKLPNMAHYCMRLYPAYWIINTIATSSAFGISIIYWVVLYDARIMVFDAVNFFVHGNNSILMMLDLLIVAHPMRILHFIYPATFAIIYTTFSGSYYLAGGTARGGSRCIYKIVDWGNPWVTLGICLGIILFVICLHIFVCLVAKGRTTVAEKCCSKEEETSGPPKLEPRTSYDNHGMHDEIV